VAAGRPPGEARTERDDGGCAMTYPPQGPPGPVPEGPWNPQPPQQYRPAPPPRRRNGWKWALGGVALIGVIAVTAAVAISMRSDRGDTSAPRETYDLASPDDTGPVEIITEDPSCDAWVPVANTFAGIQKKGWTERDSSVPAARWTPEQRAQYEEVRKAALTAADQTVALVRLTPHRVMRELYEQFIAYSRAYSDAIPNYKPEDERLARVMTSTSSVLVYVCDAINARSAAARAPLVPPLPKPATTTPLSAPATPTRFMLEPDPICPGWKELLEQFDEDTEAWQSLDSNIPASRWTSDQQHVIDSTIPLFNEFADRALEMAGQTTNPVLADFITFSAQYRRAYAAALPTYTPADSFLARVGTTAASTVYSACEAPRG
jgi:hypothetical protein